MAGYHNRKIEKGVLGEPSKIQEELEEYADAIEQGNTIMAGVELSDVYGALESLAEKAGYNMEQLRIMSDATKRAFYSGHRKSQEPVQSYLLMDFPCTTANYTESPVFTGFSFVEVE